MLSVNLGALNDIAVPGGKAVLVPLTGVDSLGGPISYSFSATDPNVQLSLVSQSSKTLVLNVSGTDKTNTPFTGILKLHLFEDLAPNTTARIEELVTQGYYNGLDFFRVSDGFVAQTGKTNGGMDTGVTLDDEFNSSLTFTSPGLLAMANRGRDTADAEFFITAIDAAGATTPIPLGAMHQDLNFRYTIFGQLVGGFDTFEKIMSTNVQAQADPGFNGEVSSPTSSITVTSAQLITDTQDAVLKVFDPTGSAGDSATITVTATNGNNEMTQQSFTANVVKDTVVDPPFLGPVANQATGIGVPVSMKLTSTDIEGAGVTYFVVDPQTLALPTNATIQLDQATGDLTVTPNAGFHGTIKLLALVRSVNANNSLSNFDTRQFSIDVGPKLSEVPDISTAVGQATSIDLTSTDPSGNGVFFRIGDPNALDPLQHVTVTVDQSTGHVVFQPDPGFSGTVDVVAAVRELASPDQVSSYTGWQFTLTIAAPTLDPVSDQSTAVGAPASFALHSTNSLGDDVLYSVVDANTLAAPDHVTVDINQSNGQTTLTPDPGFTGIVNLLARVIDVNSPDDPANYTTQAFTYTAVAPTLDPVSDQSVAVGAPVSVTLHSTNSLGDDVLYSVVDANTLAAPDHVTVDINQSNGQTTLTPDPGFTGIVNLLARVIDVNSPDDPANYTTQPFNVTFVAPTLDPVINQVIMIGLPINFALHANNSLGDAVMYSIVDPVTLAAPAHVSVNINQGTGAVNLAADPGFSGQLNLLARAIDVNSSNDPANYATQAFTVLIVAPTLEAVPDQTTLIDSPVQFTLNANDPFGNPLIYSIVDADTLTAPEHVAVDIDQSGNATITPDVGFTGTLHLAARVLDSTSPDIPANYTTQEFTLSVVTLGPVADQTSGEGAPVSFDLTASPSGGDVFFVVVDANTFAAPDHVGVEIDHATGHVTLHPEAGFIGTVSLLAGIRPTAADDVQDNYLTQEFTLTTVAPTLDPVDNQSTAMGAPVSFTAVGANPAGGGVTYKIFDASTNAASPDLTFESVDATGLITIHPNPGVTGTLQLLVGVRAAGSDDVFSNYTTQAFTLDVEAPTLDPVSNKTTSVGSPVSFDLVATDPTGGGLSYKIIDQDTGLAPEHLTVTIVDGHVTLKPDAGFHGGMPETFHLVGEVRAAGSDDVPSNYVQQEFTLTVFTPTLLNVADQTTGLGVTQIVSLSGIDLSGGTLTFKIVDPTTLAAPAHVTIVSLPNDQFSIKPDAGFTGSITLLAAVRGSQSDDVPSNYTTQQFKFTVVAPTLDPVANLVTTVNTATSVTLHATDPANDGIQRSVIELLGQGQTQHVAIDVNQSTGVVMLTPNTGFAGTIHLQARVRESASDDVAANYVTRDFDLNVDNVSLNPIGDVQVPGGKSVLVPLTGVDAAGNPITYTPSSSDPNVTVQIVSPGSKSIVLNVTGTDKNNQPFSGKLVLHLFEDLAPETTARIEQLVTQGYYNGLTFFRVLDGFVSQTGNNGAGDTGVVLDDEFSSMLTFTSPGLLATANHGRDTADAEYFITAINPAGSTSPIGLAQMPQFLDFRFTIFGQLVSGFDIFQKIMQTTVAANPSFPDPNTGLPEVSLPTHPITVTSATLINDTQNAVLKVTAPAGYTGTSTITVGGMNSLGQTFQQQFHATGVADTQVDPPFLGPVSNQSTQATVPANFNLTSTDVSGHGVVYRITTPTNTVPSNVSIQIDQATGHVTLTPQAGFTGTIQLLAGVRAADAADTKANYDTQAFTLTVAANPAVKPTLNAVNNQTTGIGAQVTFTLTSLDNGGNGVQYTIVAANSFTAPANVTVNINQQTGQVTLTPAAGFTGTINLRAGVRNTADPDAESSYDLKSFTLTVSANPIPAVPTGLGLTSASYTGPFDGNGYVSTSTVTLTVNAPTGSTVNFKRNGVVIATGTETSPGSGVFRATLPAGVLAIGANSITAVATSSTGSSADSTAMQITYAPNLNSGVYVVPGAPGSTQTLTMAWAYRNAAYNDEVGYFIADSITGSIGGIAPGQAGYARAALTSPTRNVIFTSGQKAGVSQNVSLQGGQMIVFYMIQNTTTANFLAKNPSDANHGNNNSSAPLAFFSVEAANPDGMKHTQIIADPITGRAQYNWEDLSTLGDSDFNDVVMTVRLASQSGKPPATVHAPGTGDKTVTVTGTLHSGHQTTPKGDIGVYFVDNPDGSIGSLKPGDAGYLAAALASGNFRVLFAANAAIGTQQITVPAGKYLAFYAITSGTTASFVTANPTNSTSGGPVAITSFDATNPNSINHFRWYSPSQQATDPNVQQLHIMDRVFGSDADFDDFTLDVGFSG